MPISKYKNLFKTNKINLFHCWPWLQAPHTSKRAFTLIKVRPKWRVEKTRISARKGSWRDSKHI